MSSRYYEKTTVLYDADQRFCLIDVQYAVTRVQTDQMVVRVGSVDEVGLTMMNFSRHFNVTLPADLHDNGCIASSPPVCHDDESPASGPPVCHYDESPASGPHLSRR